MNLRRRINRICDVTASVATVAVAPVVGAVGGAILLTAAMSVIAFFVITMPEPEQGYQGFGGVGD